MYRSILVPLDGSSFGEQALPYALSIARRANATLQLAHVHIPIMPVYADAVPVFDETLDVQRRTRERAYLDEVAQRLAAIWDGPISVALLDDPVADALHNHAVASGADLVVMTTHGRGALSRFWLGSIADTLVRRVPMPLLLVRPVEPAPDLAHAPGFNHVLVPLDGSALAEEILAPAVGLGRLTPARYTLLQAVEPLIGAYGTELYAAGLEEQTLAQLQASATAYLEETAGRLRTQVLRVETTAIIGPPATAILDYARTHAVDLIALATHGRSGIARLLLGSVADKVVRGATMPVLVYRPRGEEPPQ